MCQEAKLPSRRLGQKAEPLGMEPQSARSAVHQQAQCLSPPSRCAALPPDKSVAMGKSRPLVPGELPHEERLQLAIQSYRAYEEKYVNSTEEEKKTMKKPSYRHAAQKHHIDHHTTLYRRISGKTKERHEAHAHQRVQKPPVNPAQNGDRRRRKTKCTIIQAPHPFPRNGPSLFLSGATSCVPWRKTLVARLSHLPITILDPLRSDWDSSWREDISFPPFAEQVNWELDMMEAADVVAVYLHPGTDSPTSLLELGLFATSGKVIVACPEGFQRRGNVQIVCERLRIEVTKGLEELAASVGRRFGELGVDVLDGSTEATTGR